MFTDPLYAPYYSKYKGHHFIILDVPYSGHVKLQCYSDPTISVDGYVHFSDLEMFLDDN